MRTLVFKFETASTHLAYEIHFVGLRTGILRIKQNRKKNRNREKISENVPHIKSYFVKYLFQFVYMRSGGATYFLLYEWS